MNTPPAGRGSMARLTLGIGLISAVLLMAGLRPTVAGAQGRATLTAAPPATTVPALAPIPAGTAPASTLPLQTRDPSTHVSAVLPLLSAAGFILVLLMLALQWVLTKPGRQGWTL